MRRNKLFEIFNGHPQVNNLGGGGVPGLEEVWDQILSSGQTIYGIAVDDAHHLQAAVGPDGVEARSRMGGRARAAPRGARDCAGARARRLLRVDRRHIEGLWRRRRASITVAIAESPVQQVPRAVHRPRGQVLAETIANPAVYTFKGGEGYVRARVIESNGAMAWVQPAEAGGLQSR